jgi:hypothetical protein
VATGGINVPTSAGGGFLMKVFADFHHSSLFHSLMLLIENRLGGEIYRPIGIQWYDEGYWNVYPHIDTAKQYLQMQFAPIDGTIPLNEPTRRSVEQRGLFSIEDQQNSTTHKAITLSHFMDNKFDILIASIPQHIEPFKKLIRLWQPQAKLIYQVGNQWNVDSNIVKNVMASANIVIPTGINGVIYHQEFDLKTFYYDLPNMASKKIYSFINCLNTSDLYKKDWELFLALEKLMPEWEFKSFGGQCRDGSIYDSKGLADKMREATFIFHCKTNGDGYGHVIHNAAAVGRPLITRKVDYIGKMASPLIHNLDTAITIDNLNPDGISERIRHYHEHSLLNMSEQIRHEFEINVDFIMEERKIRKFLENLQ